MDRRKIRILDEQHFIRMIAQMKNSAALLLCLFLLSFPNAGQAEPPAKSGLYFSAGLKAGYGTMKSVDGSTIASRGFGVYGLNGDLGLRAAGFIFGGGLEYSLWRQAKDPADIGNSNTQGSELSWGPMLGYQFSSLTLLGRYYLGSTYDLDRANAAGRKVAYTKPAPGWVAQVRFPFGSGNSFTGFEYKTSTYESTEVAAIESALAPGAIVKTNAFSILLGLEF